MRKINKTCKLSTTYRKWEKDLEKSKKSHPEYSSQFKFYWDVVMNLFYCQDGLCIYTEKRICSAKYYEPSNWEKGRYKRSNYVPKKPRIKGELEHFDAKLKPAKGWKWDNLFMSDSDINSRAKGLLIIDSILKPDGKDYDEFKLFEYDSSMHIFRANTTLPKPHQDIVNAFADAIINYDTVVEERRISLSPILKLIEFGVETWDSIKIEEFPTAFEIIKKEKKKKAF